MEIKRTIAFFAGFILCNAWLPGLLYGQVDIRHTQPQVLERGQRTTLLFEAPSVNDSEVLEALFFFRTEGSGSFVQQEVEFRNGSAQFPIEIESLHTSSIEYYFMIRMLSGRQYTYPNVSEDQLPVVVEVIDMRIPEYPATDKVDVVVLSPLAGTTISQDDVFVSAAFFYDEPDLEGSRFNIFLNGDNITDEVELTPFMFKYHPRELNRGEHTLQVLVEENGVLSEAARWSFRVAGSVVLGSDLFFADRRREFGGNIEVGGRTQSIAGNSTDAFQGRLQLRGREGDFHYNLRSYVTTQESRRLQPQNRYTLNLRFRDNLFLNAGDASPQFSNFSIRGRRVRGLHTGVSFGNDRFQLETVYGSMSRSVDNRYEPIRVRQESTANAVEELFMLELENGGAGTFQRKISGGRFSIGKPERFQFAMNALRIRDDTTSIELVRDYNDLLSANPALMGSLNQQQAEFLMQNPDQLQVSSFTPRPQENLVVSSEVRFTADHQRIRFHTEFGASLLNQDISGGILDREAADRLGFELSENLENLFSNLSWLIIINDQMSTLPFRYYEKDSGRTGANLFFPSSILANDTRIDFDYFNHRVQLQYRWVGPDYHSLANNTIRRDVSGFTLTDRFRLVQNRLFITLGAEQLRDNVNNYKNATTKNSSVRGNVSWYPFRSQLPRISAGIRYRVRDNSVERFNPFVDPELEAAAFRNYEIANGDTLITATPRSDQILSYNLSVTQSFNLLDADHQAGASYNQSKTRSKVFEFGDSENKNYSISLLSQFEALPFRTRLSYNNTKSKALSGLNEVVIHSFDVGLDWALLNNQLLLNGIVSFARSDFESIGLVIDDGAIDDSSRDNYFTPVSDIPETRVANSYIVRFGADYSIFANSTLSLLFNYSFIENRVAGFANIPNDRIIQLNYAYRF